jgi:DNA processing protein
LRGQLSKLSFWQALTAAELSPQRSRALIRELGSFRDPLERLRSHPALSSSERERARSIDEEALARAAAQGIEWRSSHEFPPTLAESPGAPCGVFAWGSWGYLDAPTVAIVGTRGASTYGKAVATKFAEALARSGVVVVSGGAIGIDGAAHRGALAAGGRTVAVLAGGVDRLYPALHRGLFSQIRDSGCLVSQFALGSQPSAYRFLGRNGLIAAMSLAVIVVEAPLRSGAISTAHHANEQGRQVFVVPSNIDNLNFTGSHGLIRDGATLVDHPNQVLEALSITPKAAPEQPALSVASGIGEQIMKVLSVAPLAAEFIVERTGLDTSDVMAELTLLELDGRVIRDAGGYAIRP